MLARTTQAATVFTALTALAAAAVYGVTLYRYGILDTYLDHAEPAVVIRAWRLVTGMELYPPLDAADYLLVGYGPTGFLLHGLFLSLFGGGVGASKLAGIFATVVSVALLAVHVGRTYGARYVGVGVTIFVATCLHVAPFTFYARPDPQMTLLVTVALFAAALPRQGAARWAAPLIVGICLGLSINLKFHSAVYFVPIVFRYFSGRWLIEYTRIAVIGGIVALLPFAHPQVSLVNFLDGLLALVTDRGFVVVQFTSALRRAIPIFLSPLLLLPFLVWKGRWRREILYVGVVAFCVGLTLYPTSSPGASWYHMIPFLPVTVDLFMRLVRDLEDDWRVGAGAQLVFAIVFVILAVTPQKRLWRHFDRLQAESPAREVREILRKYPKSSFEMGLGQDLANYIITYVRPVLVFAGHKATVSGWSDMESVNMGLSPPAAKLSRVENCAVDYWLIPKDEIPFLMSAFYGGKPALWPEFKETFLGSYEKREGFRYFDLWGCKRPPS